MPIINVIQKRSETNSTFATRDSHTPAFNTVHIIAAVIGVMVAIIVAITVFMLCKRRKRAKLKKPETTTQMSDTLQSSARFGQFAHDFDNHIEPPKSAIVHVEDISPMMQQYQLQLKLLQQQNSSTSSSSNATTTSIPPPPPYQP